jgi:hypothetical protein
LKQFPEPKQDAVERMHLMLTQIKTGALVALMGSVSALAADQVLNWNAIATSTVNAQNPFAQARFLTIAQLAVFEAVNSITGDYKPYLGRIAARPGASPDAAAVAAAHAVLRTYFPDAAGNLDAARMASLASIPDGEAKVNGVLAGEAAAAAMIALRGNDGAGTPRPYTPLTGPGYWQPTPPAFGAAILLHWASVTPFGLKNGGQFRSDPPPSLTSAQYRRNYDEVKLVGDVASSARPQDRSDVARYFATTSAAHAWNQAARQVSEAQGHSLSQNARAFAVLNIAINDGLIASLDSKYYYHFWRPVTAIRAGATDGNPRTEQDAGFTPLIATPAFPGYPSAHASASYAAKEVLEKIYGSGNHRIALSNPAVPGVVLNYTRFARITDDVDDARVFGGIHFRFDQEAGALQGRRVGEYVNKRQLRCVKSAACESDDAR